MRRVDAGAIERVSRRIGDAALDPALWPEIMDDICRAVGATGAVLLQSDARTPDVPRTAGVEQLFRAYIAGGWHQRDLRAERTVPQLLGGATVVLDQDIVTPEEMQRTAFYSDALLRFGFQWFAAIGFQAGQALWGLAIQRTSREGPFAAADKLLLASLSPKLTEAATLSAAVGRSVVSGIANSLDLVRQPALVLDRIGHVLDWNAPADRLLDDDIRVVGRRLVVRDPAAQASLDGLASRLRTMTDDEALAAGPISVRRDGKRPVLIRPLSIPPSCRSPFFDARVLLTFIDLEPKPGPDPSLLIKVFGLTAAEARLASLIGGGLAPEGAAERLGVSRETARNQLKAVFAKTETHRQAELVALLARLAGE